MPDAGSETDGGSMRELPLILNSDAIRAVLNGRKTQTRRPVPAPIKGSLDPWLIPQLGKTGDKLWVKEGLKRIEWNPKPDGIAYAADNEPAWDITRPCEWCWSDNNLSALCCPRGLSRLTLEIVSTRVERLQDITPADVAAEGLAEPHTMEAFVKLFWSYTSWKKWPPDPWVYVREFRVAAPGE